MNIAQIESNLQQIVSELNKETFIYDLLLAYGIPKASIQKLKLGSTNLFNETDVILWKKKLYYKLIENKDIYEAVEIAKNDEKIAKHEPRFIIVTDLQKLYAIDTKTKDTLDIAIVDIAKNYDFFLPWAGMEKAQHHSENIADVKAAEKMAKLYDEIRKDNPISTAEEVHNLNVFLSRLLFCFFAEDTDIFKKSQFTHAIVNHTQADGSDLSQYLDRIFEVLNTSTSNRVNLTTDIDAFPYVNGGLFKDKLIIPTFNRKSRQIAIDCGSLEWSAINPDIFGSMIQAVITPEHRGGMGMHYTSVPNIMKVIEPLFLNELYEEFENAKGSIPKLKALQNRIAKIKLFDPACGSGNFLIIAYKELRKLENLIVQELINLKAQSFFYSTISLTNFFGIELDDFAHEVAILSLWLAKHQMDMVFFSTFGQVTPALPLKDAGKVVHGNATRLNWEDVCPKNEGDEIYILGNPPYLGSRKQDENQKDDLKVLFGSDYKSLDYISAWFYKGGNFIRNTRSKLAFVTTNSICQGEQVSITWSRILDENVNINFAYKDFKWSNNAKYNAGVTVLIVGLSGLNNSKKYIFYNSFRKDVSQINPYIIEGKTLYIHTKQNQISNLPEMNFGNMPADGGKLLFTTEEKLDFISKEPNSEKYFLKLISADEFINGKERWCLWLEGLNKELVNSLPLLKNKVNELYKIRLNSSRPNLADIPHLFAQITQPKDRDYILIPRHSSENRKYIPIGYFSSENIAHDSCLIIPTNEIYIFGIVTSKIHMAWVHTVCGRLETRYRYSKDVVYNNFPFPPISENQKQELENHVFNILEEREKHSEKTLAELYDPEKMPDGLREAHHQNDLAIERCYRSKPFESDEERLEYLFKLYEQMIDDEKTKGTLFEVEKKAKGKKKK